MVSEAEIQRITKEAEQGHGCEVKKAIDEHGLPFEDRIDLLKSVVQQNRKNIEDNPNADIPPLYFNTSTFSPGPIGKALFDDRPFVALDLNWHWFERPLYGEKLFLDNGELRQGCRRTGKLLMEREEDEERFKRLPRDR